MKILRFITAAALFLTIPVGNSSAQIADAKYTNQWIAARRQVLAVRYNENKQTTVTMDGTTIAPRVMGKADVEFKQGRTNVRLEMKSLANPQSLGGFYTTYILWAVAPEGQAENLMELPILKNFKIESTTKFQTFGLIITAEPHSRVELPGPMIVAENTLRKGTEGMLTTSKIEYSGDPGTFYGTFLPNFPSISADYNTPLMILGSRRAVEIARRADAKKFAEPELREAELKLATLEQAWPRSRKASDLRDNARKNSGLAHDVMRIAEQARKLSIERSDQAELSAERRQAGDSIAQAQSEADRARADAERSSTDAVRARIEAERAKAAERDQALRAASEAEMARERVEQAQSETAKAKANEGVARHDADNARLQAEEAKRERDTAGSEMFNLNLSRGRAESVRDYLVQNGIKSERVIAARGFGETKPVADNETAAGRQVNRRVEIIIADHPQAQAKAGNQ